MATPERRAEAERNFVQQLDACGASAVVDGTVTGPYPLEHAAPHVRAAIDRTAQASKESAMSPPGAAAQGGKTP